jgi:hypothetical protein
MRSFITLFFVLTTLFVAGQISTDRPTQSFSPFSMPAGKVQLESGFASERPQSKVDYYNVTYVNALVRAGITKGFELRVTQNYLGERTLGAGDNGWSATSLGTKIQLIEEKDLLPQIAVIGTYSFAGGSGNFYAGQGVTDIRFLFRNNLSDRVSLDYNVGSVWDGEMTTGIYTLCLGFSATDKLGIFLEPYGFFAKNTPSDHRFNTGFTYLVTDNFQLDGSIGNGLVSRSPDYFMAFGASILF